MEGSDRKPLAGLPQPDEIKHELCNCVVSDSDEALASTCASKNQKVHIINAFAKLYSDESAKHAAKYKSHIVKCVAVDV